MSLGRVVGQHGLRGAVAAVVLVLGLAGRPGVAEAGKRSLCGVAGCSLPAPRISRAVMLAAFATAYRGGYRANYCDDNIHKLVQRLARAGADLRRFEVLYLMPTRRHLGRLTADTSWPIAPLLERRPEVTWLFHVVLRVGAEILDLDYRRAPTVVRVDRYFRTMWDAGTRARLGVRVIPAAEYLREYGSRGRPALQQPPKNYAYYLNDLGYRYRLLSARSYVWYF